MQLTRFTDIGLRVLMYLTQPERDDPVTISEIADQFDISRNHLVKVVHFMAQHGWIVTTRGKGGGLALAMQPCEYRMGQVVRSLEGTTALINCHEPACGLRMGCNLRSLLGKALNDFYGFLDQYTLADTVAGRTGELIAEMTQARLIIRAS
jgi:Rrf2 family nitric oxide-sensitive transcriptional repressor